MEEGKKVTVVACGDSVTAGAYVRNLGEEENYVEIWEKRLQNRFKNPFIKVINNGKSGALARDGYNSLHHAIKRRPDLVTVMFGRNDCGVGADLEIFEMYIKKIVLCLRQYTNAQALLLTPNPLLDINLDLKSNPYLEIIRKVGEDLDVELIDIHRFFERKFTSGLKREDCFYRPEDFLKVGYKYIDEEELYIYVVVHPSQKGHELIAEALMEFKNQT